MLKKISEDEKEGICDKVKTLKYSSPNNVFLQYLGMFALSFILSVESPGATAAGSLFGLTPILSAIFSIGGGS